MNGKESIMEIRPIEKSQLSELTRLSYRGYPTIRDFSKEAIKNYEADMALIFEKGIPIHPYGYFDHDKLVGIMLFFDFKMNIYGNITPVAGLGFLAIDPFYKRQGIGTKMAAFFESEALRLGYDTAVLLPFRPDFYSKLGYAPLTKMNSYEVQTQYFPTYSGPLEIRPVKEIEDILELRALYAEGTHGMMYLTPFEARDFYRDFERAELIYPGVYDNNNLLAYTSYYFESILEENYTKNYIITSDIISTTPESLRALLSHFNSQQDQADYVKFYTQYQGMEHLFSNPLNNSMHYIANGYLETNTQALGLMAKILDPELWWSRHGDFFNLDSISWRIGDKLYGETDQIVTIDPLYLAPLWFSSISMRDLYQLGLVDCDLKLLPKLIETFDGVVYPINNTDF